MARPGGLGRGLGALIPATSAEAGPAGDAGLRDLPVAAIRPNRYQPRERFDEESLAALADSIREVGLLQPVLVRPVGGGYELVAGERRWRAAKRAGLQQIPALVRDTDDSGSLERALVENLQREELNPLEEAAAYQQLVEDFKLTHEQVAARVGRSRAAVSNMLRLLQLPPSIQRAVREGQVQMGHARALLGTPDRAFQEALAQRIVAEGLSVRFVEEAVRAHIEGEGDQAGAGKTARLRPGGIDDLEELLGDLFETRVRISMSNPHRGRVVIEFADFDDLERIYRIMTDGKRTPAA